jgi:hypothetical protein
MLCTPRASLPALCVIAGLLLGVATPALAQDKPDPTVINAGKDDFEWQCAPCHGTDGTGNGPMAKQLIKAPTNLTGIAKNNDGTFPSIASSPARKRCRGTRPSRCRSFGSALPARSMHSGFCLRTCVC